MSDQADPVYSTRTEACFQTTSGCRNRLSLERAFGPYEAEFWYVRDSWDGARIGIPDCDVEAFCEMFLRVVREKRGGV